MCWVSIVIKCRKKIELKNIEGEYGKVDKFSFIEVFWKFMCFKCKVSV